MLVLGLNYAPETTGIAPYTARMAEGLTALADVTVLTTPPHYPQWRVDPDHRGWTTRSRSAGVDVTRLRHYVPHNPRGVTRILSELSFTGRVLPRLHHLPRPDAVVVVSPGLVPAAAGVRWAVRRGIPVGVVVQDIYSFAVDTVSDVGRGAGWLKGRVRRTEAAMIASATGVLTIHDRMAEALSQLGPVPRERITVVRNWTHVDPPRDPAALRAALGWPEDRRVLLHAGNMGAKQNLDVLVEVARLAEQCDQPLDVVLMGDGVERRRLEQVAAGLERISFLDGVPEADFTSVLAAADVLCVSERPGLQEMCAPSKLTSYLVSGRPVVAATAPDSAAADDLRASGAGVVVTPDDPMALLEAALRLAGPETDLGTRGPAYAAAHLGEQQALDGYRSWVESLLSGDGNR